MKIADHFTIKELTRLAQFCERVRSVLNVPMNITSGVRCPKLNKKVGGTETSDHIKLLAVDFVPSKIKLKTAFDKIRKSSLDYKQLILEKNTWIHISLGEKKEALIYDGKKYKRV